MTEIKVYTTENGFELETVGHSGYSAKGTDIVCSAVSTLTQTLLYRVMDLTILYDWTVHDGYLYIAATGENIMEAYNTIMTGLNVLESSYPDFVHITSRGCPIKEDFYKLSYSHKGRDLPQ